LYNPEKTLTFSASTAEEKAEWIELLCSTINRLRELKPLSESGMVACPRAGAVLDPKRSRQDAI